MVVSAEKSCERAEARRLRILAKANERLDVVSGLVPSSDVGKVLEQESTVMRMLFVWVMDRVLRICQRLW
jgi:hypothetical protein